MNTQNQILKILKTKGSVSPHELAEILGVSSRTIFKQLSKLLVFKKVVRSGSPPKVYYKLADTEINTIPIKFPAAEKRIINQNYTMITPFGERIDGINGFIYWCNKNKLPIQKTASEYIKTLRKYKNYEKKGIIDGTKKLNDTFKNFYLDKLFYLQFYSIERFGKTRLGSLLLYAKQSQNSQIIKELVNSFKEKVLKVIKRYNISAIGFLPPTVKREVQFMKELEKVLNISLPVIAITKVKTPIVVPQKTLSKIEDRIENAEKTIIITENRKFKNILLIDDAVGSGASMNEVAKKIKEKKICTGKLYGVAITGSFKGFDVISEI